MEIHLKINDVRGQDEKGRHILWINDEDLRQWLDEHQGYVLQNIVQPMLKHHPAKLQEIIDDPTMRNVIYMQEKAKREEKQEKKRQRIHSEEQLREKREEAKRARQNEQFMKSKAYRKSIDFYRDILGIEDNGNAINS